MLEAYIVAGFVPETFWRLTPKLYWIYMNGARNRLIQQHNKTAWAIWHAAYLPRTKKPIKLSSMMIENSSSAVIKSNWERQYQLWLAYCNRKRGRET